MRTLSGATVVINDVLSLELESLKKVSRGNEARAPSRRAAEHQASLTGSRTPDRHDAPLVLAILRWLSQVKARRRRARIVRQTHDYVHTTFAPRGPRGIWLSQAQMPPGTSTAPLASGR